MDKIRLYATEDEHASLEAMGLVFDHEHGYFCCEDSLENRFKFAKYIKNEEKFASSFENLDNVSLKIGVNVANELIADIENAKRRIYILNNAVVKDAKILKILSKIKDGKKYLDLKILAAVESREELKNLDKNLQEVYKYKIVDDMEKVFKRNQDIRKFKDELQFFKQDFESNLIEIEEEIKVHHKLIDIKQREINKIDASIKRYIFFAGIAFCLMITTGILAYVNNEYKIAIASLIFFLVGLGTASSIFSNKKQKVIEEDELELLNADEDAMLKERKFFIEKNNIEIESLEENLQGVKDRDVRSVLYSENFELKLLDTYANRNKLINSNINFVIIDDVVYMGGFDFTVEGLFGNMLSLFKIKDTKLADNLALYFNNFYSKFALDLLGKDEISTKIYDEDSILKNHSYQ